MKLFSAAKSLALVMAVGLFVASGCNRKRAIAPCPCRRLANPRFRYSTKTYQAQLSREVAPNIQKLITPGDQRRT